MHPYAEYLEEPMKAREGAGDAVNMLQSVDRRACREQRHLPSKFSDPLEIYAFTAKSFVLLTNRVLILTSC